MKFTVAIVQAILMAAQMTLKVELHYFCFDYKICFETAQSQPAKIVEAIHSAIYKKLANF